MVVTPDIKFPRAVVPVDVKAEYELLGFWDGGKPASAAVIYIRHKLAQPNGEETHSVRLLRVVSNSSLDNNNSGLSLNNCLTKGPNTLVPLIQSTVAWRSYQHCEVWDLSKAYNVVHTTDKKLHLRRLV